MKRKIHNPLRHKSGLEEKVATQLDELGIQYKFEPKDGKISYEIPASTHTYLPDFYITTKSGKQIIVETKGIWDYDDRYKHLLIRKQHPHLDIRFVFTRSRQHIKKGSRTTYADICEGNGRSPFRGIKWAYADRTIPIKWLQE